jgi:ABC-type transport system involved in multi-copper enzyme maturation permease subunit
MATRAIRPKRDDGPLGGNWESLPERAPSLVRADQPLIPRIIAMVALVVVAIGALAMVAPSWNLKYVIGPEWGFFWFTIGVSGLLYHAFSDKDLQFRRVYGLLGFVLLAAAVVMRAWPTSAGTGAYFMAFGTPCLALALVFLLAVARHETDEFWRLFIMRLLGTFGGAMVFIGFFFSTVSLNVGFLRNNSADFLPGEGVVWIILGLLYVSGFIGMQEAGSRYTFRVGLALGAVGALVFVVALIRSLLPWIRNLPPSESYWVPNGLLLMGFSLVYGVFALGICSDNVFVVLTRRELAAFFYSPVAYLVILGMALIGWFMHLNFVKQLEAGPIDEPIVARYILNFIAVACLIFVYPVLTMRLLSEEKRSGTLEVLLTAPLNEISVVLSKFFASLIFFLFTIVPWVLFLVVLRVVGDSPFDYRPMLSFLISMTVTSAGFLAMGLFFSAITRNQIIAAVLTFATIMAFTVVFWQVQLPPPWSDILTYISYLELWITSLDGQFAPRLLLFPLSVTVFFLYLTTKVLEARKWA